MTALFLRASRRFNEYVVIAVLLLIVCLAHFGAAYAGTTDPTPSQMVSAIKRAHIEGIAAGDPNLAARFVLYRLYASGPPVYGAHPGSGYFSLSNVRYLTVNGQHLVLFSYTNGGNAGWQDFAFFVGSLNYAGELPFMGRNARYQSVGSNLVIRLHTLRGSDPMCCPSGPWRTVATLSANAHGLFTVTPNPAATPSTRIASVGAASPAHPSGASAVVRQFYAWYMKIQNHSGEARTTDYLAPVRGLFDDRLYWLLKEADSDHPGSKPRYGMECSLDANPFGLGQMYSRIWSFTVGAPTKQGDTLVVPVTLFLGHTSPGGAGKITAIVKDEAGAYKIYDINDFESHRQFLEKLARDPNCAWPK